MNNTMCNQSFSEIELMQALSAEKYFTMINQNIVNTITFQTLLSISSNWIEWWCLWMSLSRLRFPSVPTNTSCFTWYQMSKLLTTQFQATFSVYNQTRVVSPVVQVTDNILFKLNHIKIDTAMSPPHSLKHSAVETRIFPSNSSPAALFWFMTRWRWKDIFNKFWCSCRNKFVIWA